MYRHNHFILKGMKWRKSENDTDDLIISYMYTIYFYSSSGDTSIVAPIHTAFVQRILSLAQIIYAEDTNSQKNLQMS